MMCPIFHIDDTVVEMIYEVNKEILNNQSRGLSLDMQNTQEHRYSQGSLPE
jgi:hypothetical protein